MDNFSARTMKLKHIFPKSRSGIVASAFLVGILPTIYFYELLVVLPTVHPGLSSTWAYVHIFCGTALFINCVGSIWKMMTVEITCRGHMLPSVLKPGWRFCYVCEHNAPPRSMHCSECDTCVLTRDHHCLFTDSCVGHSNKRYYMNFLITLCIGAIYCNIMNFDYTWHIIGGISFKSVFTMLLPMLTWLLGYAESFTFSVAFMSALCVVGCALLLVLCTYHLMLILNGQTVYEKAKNIRDFDLGWKKNIIEVFGDHWYIAWISPFIPSTLPSIGIEPPKRTRYEDLKDM
ncbi:unnamed protein product [Owenia fusiformis]|uniref:Palmitoyltransferase n=1 Tax=Owenia fusiformis TaxID=6347 RepID=A0A8J1XS08_OWEFU|nr:unnamed protein product [Owenia fusiformis]